MPINPARLEKLKELGLTEYQARAYLALLDLGVAPAKDVASLSRVPKSKIYSTLDQLHDKGLLRVVPEHPKRYQVLNIESYLRDLSTDYETRLSFIHDRRDDLVKEFNPRGDVSLEERGGFTVLKGRRNLETKVQEMVAAAKGRFLIVGTEMAPRRLVHILDELAAAAERGVLITLRTPATERNEEALQRLQAHVTVEPAPQAGPLSSGTGVTFYLVDGREALLAHYIPDDAHFYQGDDVAVWTDDGSLSSALDALAVARLALGPGEPRLPDTVEEALRAEGDDPLTLLRALAETVAHAPAGTDAAHLQAQGLLVGGLVGPRLAATDDPEARLRAAADLFRHAGLAEVAPSPEGPGLGAVLTPLGKASLSEPWRALLSGVLQGIAGGPDSLRIDLVPGSEGAPRRLPIITGDA